MTFDMSTTSVGFIGLGIMGRSMAGHIFDDGWRLNVYNRTRAKADELVGRGAVWHETPAQVAAASQVVFTILGGPDDVEQVYLGREGLIRHAAEGSILVDMTTSSPGLAERLAEAAESRGVWTIDAPVSGGDVGARDAKLSIMAGGPVAAFEAALPLLRLMGTSVVRQGDAGAGQHTKMANQIAIACTMVGVCETLAYARASGLDPERVLSSIGTGAAAGFLLNNLGPKALHGDYAPGFFVHHFIKDLGIALEEADRKKLTLPGLQLAGKLYQQLADAGHADDGTQALYRLYGG